MPLYERLPYNFFDDAVAFKIDGIYCKLIPLTRHEFSIVNLSDYCELSKYSWYAKLGSDKKRFYAVRNIPKGKGQATVRMHQALTGNKSTDHKNGVSLDNRRSNLRSCTASQNGANRGRHSSNKSGFKGVSFHKATNKFQAQICFHRKVIFLGIFDDPRVAHEAYKQAASRLYGEFVKFQ